MDTYRPGESRRPHPRESDSYRPRRYDRPSPPPWPPSNFGRNGMYHFQGSRDRDPPRQSSYRQRQGYRSARPPPAGGREDHRRRPSPPAVKTAANRPLLKFRHEKATTSSVAHPTSEAKFRNLDELTDSEEEEMAQSEDEIPDRHLNKRIRLDRADSDVAPAPKWSNPDPYTSLPPAGDATAKRTDVVKLIRKARIDTNHNPQKAHRPDDFISFDADEHSSDDELVVSLVKSPSPPPPAALPPPRADAANVVIGKRKRGLEVGDEGRHPHPDNQVYADECVQAHWEATTGVDPTPWLRSHPLSNSAGVALHKEIIDFYDWVQPKPHEEEVRGAVFQRLNKLLQDFTRGELKAFGSYAAGLYLPTADMDLVYLTRSFKPGRSSKAQAGRLVIDGAKFLRRRGMAQGSVVPIANAKVPIIKFVDRISGLKIDLSFDNDTGVVAIDTFHKWKKEYPIMPIIVSVVKQYLMIRGLNDVSTGGLGGFSTICLVTSFLQHLPITQRPVNLGDALLEFFNYYGNVFDRRLTILRLDPPAYLDKATHPIRFSDKDDARLTIIDPHRSDNNISGGTKHIDVILKCFSKAHTALVTRLTTHEKGATRDLPSSFLGCLIGGNFTAYDQQRRILRDLSGTDEGPTSRNGDRRPNAPARSVEANLRANRTDQSSVTGSSSETAKPVKTSKAQSKGERRAQRLKELRPELGAMIRNSISHLDALKIGGYKTRDDMIEDLDIREAAAAKLSAEQNR